MTGDRGKAGGKPWQAGGVAAAGALLLGCAGAAPTPAADRPCADGQQAVFACSTGSRRVAVCASPDLSAQAGSLQYRFGPPGAPELVLPATADDWRTRVHADTLAYSGGGGAWIAFDQGRHRYVVYTAIGRGWGSQAGVVVEHDGRRIASLHCKDEPASQLGPDLFGRAGLQAGGQAFELP